MQNETSGCNRGLEQDDPECDLDYTKGKGVHVPVRVAISNSLGFKEALKTKRKVVSGFLFFVVCDILYGKMGYYFNTDVYLYIEGI